MPTKENSVVAFKVCPKCHGLGKIPCDGKEHHRRLHETWAKSFHLVPVVYQSDEHPLPGLAVAELMPGGWYSIKVYVAVTAIPKPSSYYPLDGMAYKLDGRGVPQSAFSINKVGLWYFDIINDKAFWHVSCRWDDRDDLVPLGHWPDIFKLEDRKLLEEFSNNQRASTR